MARKVTAVGGFYSFISHGLGRELGMGTGLAITLAYSVFEASLCGGFAFFATRQAGPVRLPLLVGLAARSSWSLLISVLSYFDVHISARVLGVALVSEVLILLVFDSSVFFTSGSNVQASAINPFNAFHSLPASGTATAAVAAGAAGIGIFFAFWSWVGFEMAPNYGEESKNPKKIVPRAMYISVIGLGIFYTVTSWASISAYPSTGDRRIRRPERLYDFYLIPAKQFGNQFSADLMSYLILTGSFACGMAFHNTTARYMYSLGASACCRRPSGRTHPKHRSPHIASITQSVIAPVIVLAVRGSARAPATAGYQSPTCTCTA